jgi:uridine kinase
MSVAEVVETLVELAGGQEARIACSVAGESGSGKTTLAHQLAELLAAMQLPAVVLSQDDYFELPPRQNAARRVAVEGWIGLGEVRLDLLGQHVAAFVAGASTITKPCVLRAEDRISSEQLDWGGACVLIVEGTYVTRLEPLALRVFLAGDYRQTEKARRIRARDSIDEHTDAILAHEHRIIQQDKQLADIVLDGWLKAAGPLP